MPKKNPLNLSVSIRGDYQRSIGIKANGKPHLFYLGRDLVAARIAVIDLEKVWKFVKSKYGCW